LNKVSDKQEIDLAKRRLLKYELWLEQNVMAKNTA